MKMLVEFGGHDDIWWLDRLVQVVQVGWAEETSQDWWVILTQPTKRTVLESHRDLYVGFVKQAFPENRLTPFSHGGSIQHLWPQACLWMAHILHVSQIILGSLLFLTGYDTTLLEYHTNQLGSGKQSYIIHIGTHSSYQPTRFLSISVARHNWKTVCSLCWNIHILLTVWRFDPHFWWFTPKK